MAAHHSLSILEIPVVCSEHEVDCTGEASSFQRNSDGETHTSEKTEKSRKRYERIRSRLQAAGTRSAKRHLKKLAKRERRMKRDANHVISKRLVSKAVETNRGISLEDLQGIRKRTTVRKAQRSRHGKWAFGELRAFIEYKARLAGVALVAVDPLAPAASAGIATRPIAGADPSSSVNPAGTLRSRTRTQL